MDGNRSIAVNRKARYEYDILDSIEAGLVLVGTEIKAIREGRANFSDAYAPPRQRRDLADERAHLAVLCVRGDRTIMIPSVRASCCSTRTR